MKNLGISLLLLASSAVSYSATVKDARFDSKSGKIEVDVVYGGGCKEHKFTLKHKGCFESLPAQCQMTLVELSGQDDMCEALVGKTLVFNASEFNLGDSYYSGASITIQGDDKSSATFVNKQSTTSKEEPKANEPTVTCSAGSGKFIKFVPQYGEVHFVDDAGNDIKDHHDGLTFETLILESHPVKVQTKIKEEGEVVGGWEFTDGAKTFTANYRGKAYKACREE